MTKIEDKPVSKRDLLIHIGTAIFTQKGFSITSLDDIVAQAGVPKGSFYYYFGTKDEFAIEVIKNYGAYFSRKIQRHLEDKKKSPLRRMKSFTKEAIEGVDRFEFKRGCLIGNLGQEMASLEESFRVALFDVINDWRDQFTACIDESKNQGEIATKVSSTELARFFWSAWEGAVLCAKLEKSTRSLTCVTDLFFNHLLLPIQTTKGK